MKTSFTLSILVVFLSGCIVVHQPPTQDNVNTPENTKYEIETISQAIEACKKVQEAKNIPVGCDLKYIKGKPAMYMTFANLDDSENWTGALAETIGIPYCESANKSGREAFIVSVVHSINQGKIFRCESWEWGEWFSIKDEPEDTSTPNSISEAFEACKRIQAASNIPIGCEPTYLKGVPAMLVAFPDRRTGDQWLEAFAEKIGEPFCRAANNGSRRALLVFAYSDVETARAYDCESSESSDWFSISGDSI